MKSASFEIANPQPEPMSGTYPPIEDYGVIGDCRSAALVSKEGSIDWLCWPDFHSPAIFAALLDADRGGRWRIRPSAEGAVRRRYLPDTCVLETTFETDGGRLRLLDCMPVADEKTKKSEIWPQRQIVRWIECTAGEVEIETLYDPRPDYGRIVPDLEDHGSLGLQCERGPEILVLMSDLSLGIEEGGAGAAGRATLHEGEVRHQALTYTREQPAWIPPLGEAAGRRIRQSAEWWRGWIGECAYEGPYRDQVYRSILTLKLMTSAPTGAIIAAPTTSLPEQIGGVRNWDYRYCWLRDASLTLTALFRTGYRSEARAFLSWMLHATRTTHPELNVLYDIYGATRLRERELEHLEGYRGSRPVRIGNDAQGQLQLDLYGEVVLAAYRAAGEGERVDRSTARMLVGLGKYVCRHWREPDEGIWELRSEPRHHTYSRAMCWIALDRLLAMAERGQVDVPVAEFEREREAIRVEVEERGWNEEIQSYTTELDGNEVDASLLLLGLEGYVSPSSPRFRSTCRRIQERLGREELLYRYLEEDGLEGSEGAFGIASFWGVEALALAGDLEEATERFERLLERANDIGLYAEEIDPENGAALGNFPQAFTHVGLIGAALTLRECRERGGADVGSGAEVP